MRASGPIEGTIAVTTDATITTTGTTIATTGATIATTGATAGRANRVHDAAVTGAPLSLPVCIVLEGLRGEESIATLCRREGIVANLYYRWSKEFLEAGGNQLQGDTWYEARAELLVDGS